MPIEDAKYISQLVPTSPQGGESISEGDDHLRTIKTAVKGSFPNVNAAVTMTPEQLNSIPQLAGDIATLETAVEGLGADLGDSAYHGNVASCYYNTDFLDLGIQGGIVYGHNIQSVAPHQNGLSTIVNFQKPLDAWDDDISAHYAFSITPVIVSGGTGHGNGPIIANVVAATKNFITFKAFQLDTDDSIWYQIDGARMSFSLMVTDMNAGQ